MGGQLGILALELPSIDELKRLDSVITPTFSPALRQELDQFGMTEIYEHELDELLNKYDKYKGSETYLKQLSGLAFIAGRDELGEKALKEALELSNSSFLQEEIGDLYFSRGDYVAAKKQFKDLLNYDQSTPYPYFRLAQIALLEREQYLAYEYIDKAIEHSPEDYEIRLLAGVFALARKEFEIAIRHFKVAIEEQPDDYKVNTYIAFPYWAIGLDSKAIRFIKRSLSLNPYNETAVRFYAHICSENKIPEACINQLSKYLEHDQTNPKIWAALASAYYEVGKQTGQKSNFHKSYEALQYQLKLQDESYVLNNIGLTLLAQGSPASARKMLNLALAKAIKEEDEKQVKTTGYNILCVFVEEAKYEEGLNFYGKMFGSLGFITEETPSEIEEQILLIYAVLLEANEEYQMSVDAITSFLRNYKLSDNLQLDFLNRLIYLDSTNQKVNGIEQYIDSAKGYLAKEKLFDRFKLRRVVNNLAFHALEFDRLKEADAYLNQLSAEMHNDPYATATLGLSYLKKGYLDRGRELYEEAISLLPDVKTKDKFRQRMYFELGKAYMHAGKSKKALKMLERVEKQSNGYKFLNLQARNYCKLIIHD